MADRHDLHQDYVGGALDEAEVERDPLRQFLRWYGEAETAGEVDPPAAVLATATREGRPSARMVYLRRADARGFVFFTNYASRKGTELAENPRAALVFFWPRRHRQVRIEGGVERCSAAESDEYFAGRPRGSQLGAWASPQSGVIADREVLAARVGELALRHPGAVPRPDFWGGYRIVPDTIEFWQGRESRLHDRLRFRREADDAWLMERLGP